MIATAGDARLGGDDWDRCFMDWALDQNAHLAARSAMQSVALTACRALPRCIVRVLRGFEAHATWLGSACDPAHQGINQILAILDERHLVR